MQKVIKEEKAESSSSDTASDNKVAIGETSSDIKAGKKGRPRKEVTLSVKPTRVKAKKTVKTSTKSALKSTILSKRKIKAEENDIEDDLEKIKAIVGDVESSEK